MEPSPGFIIPNVHAIYQRTYSFRGREHFETRIVIAVGFDPMWNAEGVTWGVLDDNTRYSFSMFSDWEKWADDALCIA